MLKKLYKVLLVALGMALGCLASAAIAALLLQTRAAQLNRLMGAAPTATEDVADPAIYNLLAQADQSIQSGNPQAAIDLLLPVVEDWPSTIDRTTGYQLLVLAELKQKQPQKAIPYALKMSELTPGSYSYQLLAAAYDGSGDLPRALGAYQQMMLWADNDKRSDFETARARILSISQTLGTPVPPAVP